jgi:mono/diheme cytochrome c family protein
MKFIAGFVLALVLQGLAGLALIYWGVYNVAAARPDSALEQWILSTASDHSVERYAKNIAAPASFVDEQVRRGFRTFNEMCVGCHGAPGKERDDVGKGLNPRPPDLAKEQDLSSSEVFWVIKNGIRMSGMPSLGAVYKDEDIWNIVSFVKQLPNINAQQYSELEKAGSSQPQAK